MQSQPSPELACPRACPEGRPAGRELQACFDKLSTELEGWAAKAAPSVLWLVSRQPHSSGPDLHVGRALAVRCLAEVGVVVLDQRLQVVGLLEALERGLAGELVHRHV